MSKPVTIGHLVRFLRKRAGMSLGDVATHFDVSVTALSALERHENKAVADCKAPPPTAEQKGQLLDADRAMHPYGRCTCAGEGTCAWHRGICSSCEGEGCLACCQSGRKDPLSDLHRAEILRLSKWAEEMS
jgi:hypothetical protein